MSIKIHNTYSNKKEEFVPLKEGEVKIYCCGPTVYNFFHIGNARPFVFFDCVRRYFEYKGYKVTFVQNFTDVDDKIIKKANEDGVPMKEVTEKYIKEYFIDADGLGIRRADVHPKVSEHMDDIINMVEALIENKHAYNINGNVYFDVESDPDYGKLSGQSLEDLKEGARIEVSDEKKSPLDFALWKRRKENEAYWEAPFGEGRPGWHIECSAMSRHYLGETIDIHGGGEDLVFPHHENEVAQSECANCKEFVRYFMHNAYLNIDGKKMGKSLNNFLMVRDISKEFELAAVRLFLLSAHYRSPLNFTREQIASATSALSRLRNTASSLEFNGKNAKGEESAKTEEKNLKKLNEYTEHFEEAMDDDFNTANALSSIFEMAKFINTTFSAKNSKEALETVKESFYKLCDILGLDVKVKEEILAEEIEALIEKRQNARAAKDFKTADAIRDELLEKGIILKDTRDGVKWEKA